MRGPTIALYRPMIPPNTGNIARLCVAIQSKLYIIGKAGFSWEDKQLKRAGLDYWENLSFEHEMKFKNFYQKYRIARKIGISKQGNTILWDYSFKPSDVLIFGNEKKGLPPSMLSILEDSIRIPMPGISRSLNLSNAVSIVAYEFLRQMKLNYFTDHVFPNNSPRTYYKR